MTDKVQKIREEVQKIARSINPYIPDDEGKNSEYEAGRFAMVTQIMQIIDSMQEEPKKCMYSKDDFADEARKAVEIAREEELEYTKYQLDLRLPETLDYNGVQVDREDFINDFVKAMKDE